MITANVADNESRVQALARCELSAACIHTRRAENSGWKFGGLRMGSIPGTFRRLMGQHFLTETLIHVNSLSRWVSVLLVDPQHKNCCEGFSN